MLVAAEPFRGGTALEVLVTNASAESVTEVSPEVTFAHVTTSGDPVTLASGAHRTWVVPLVRPSAPGTFPATVRVRYRDPVGRAATAVLALPVATAGASGDVLAARLEIGPLARSGGAQLVIENSASRPVAGRAALVAPDRLWAQPESQPAEVPAAGQTRLPFVLQDRHPELAEAAVVFAVVEYDLDGVHHTIVVEAEAAATPGQHGGRRLPLLVGFAALATCLAMLGIASRRVRARHSAEDGRGAGAAGGGAAAPPPRR